MFQHTKTDKTFCSQKNIKVNKSKKAFEPHKFFPLETLNLNVLTPFSLVSKVKKEKTIYIILKLNSSNILENCPFHDHNSSIFSIDSKSQNQFNKPYVILYLLAKLANNFLVPTTIYKFR